MEEKHLNRLREEQQLAIAQTEDKINTFKKYKEDYKNLQERLKSLPDKVTHSVMVPFGKKAFMPGQLVHTNEILVLLGDDWFVDRSAKQACDIVDRRVTVLDKQISELEQQMSLLTPRLEFTSQLQDIAQQNQDVVEITEEYDAEKEKIWRDRHKENIRKYNKQLRKEQREAASYEECEEMERREEMQSEAEFWARLDELENQEEDQGELDASSSEASKSDEESGDSDVSRDSNEENFKKVKWKDESQPSRSRTCNVIRFSHSSSEKSVRENKEGAAAAALATKTLNSPADIYELFAVKDVPKSILKHHTADISKPEQWSGAQPKALPDPELEPFSASQPRDQKVASPSAKSAFSGMVVEKSGDSLKEKEAVLPSDTSTRVDRDVPKKVSKFKAQRMQSKR